MIQCPSCKEVAFRDGRCHKCGWAPPRRRPSSSGGRPPARVVTGTPAPAPLPADALQPLPADALQPVESDAEVPPMPGFEGTMLDERVRPAKAPPKREEEEEGGFVYETCPKCRTPQPKPNPTFCEGCGQRLGRKKKSKADERIKRCTDCGTRNPADRSLCRNCGVRLLELD